MRTKLQKNCGSGEKPKNAENGNLQKFESENVESAAFVVVAGIIGVVAVEVGIEHTRIAVEAASVEAEVGL